ncbi:MAG TPA: aquaporin [Solirubrobacteraceae bacterium]|nr:aquaporin [Solirubrobacteraceae bacterium]
MEARTASGAHTARPDRDNDDLRRRGPDAYAAELIGTLLLVFFIGAVVSINSADGLGFTDWSVIGLLHFLLLTMLVYTVGHASGAHFNPAVTVTLAALRKIGPIDAAIYIVLQIIGAILGALLVKLLLSDEGDASGYGATTISDQFLQGKALAGFLAELIGTFALMWAIMGVAVNPKGARDWAGIVIGGTLGFAVMVMGPLTGAGLNPARAFGPSLVGGGEAAGDFIVAYTLGPIVGALLAGVLYTALILAPEGRAPGRREIDTLSGASESERGSDPVIDRAASGGGREADPLGPGGAGTEGSTGTQSRVIRPDDPTP